MLGHNLLVPCWCFNWIQWRYHLILTNLKFVIRSVWGGAVSRKSTWPPHGSTVIFRPSALKSSCSRLRIKNGNNPSRNDPSLFLLSRNKITLLTFAVLDGLVLLWHLTPENHYNTVMGQIKNRSFTFSHGWATHKRTDRSQLWEQYNHSRTIIAGNRARKMTQSSMFYTQLVIVGLKITLNLLKSDLFIVPLQSNCPLPPLSSLFKSQKSF